MITDAEDAIKGSLYDKKHIVRFITMSENALTLPNYEHFLRGPSCQESEEAIALIVGRAAEGRRSFKNALKLKQQKL